jgi:hypothetical protein
MSIFANNTIVPLNLNGASNANQAYMSSGHLVSPNAPNSNQATGTAVMQAATPPVNPLLYLAVIVLFLVGIKFASEHERSGFSPTLIGVGVWNMIAVGGMALLFILCLKIVVNKYQVPGLTTLVNAA